MQTTTESNLTIRNVDRVEVVGHSINIITKDRGEIFNPPNRELWYAPVWPEEHAPVGFSRAF
jgi:hypothetical protein